MEKERADVFEPGGLPAGSAAWRLCAYLLAKAEDAPRRREVRGTVFDLAPGDALFGRGEAAAALGIEPHEARRALAALERAGVAATRPTGKGTVVSFSDWEGSKEAMRRFAAGLSPEREEPEIREEDAAVFREAAQAFGEEAVRLPEAEMRPKDVRPAFFKDDRLASCSPAARLLFLGLFMLADDDGRLENRPLRIRAEVFPFDDADVEELLSELETAGLVFSYEAEGLNLLWSPRFAPDACVRRLPPRPGRGADYFRQVLREARE